jgi:hypothetical protein
MVLLGCIPVCKLKCLSKVRQSEEGYQLHKLLESLVKASQNGVNMDCTDGLICTIYPILSAYLVDYPEQCLVTCCKENACPNCLVKPKDRGACIYSVLHDPEMTLDIIGQHVRGKRSPEFVSLIFCTINLFENNLPHCNIFSYITPDILHQLYRGVFKDHIVS